jgi:ribosomal protein S4
MFIITKAKKKGCSILHNKQQDMQVEAKLKFEIEYLERRLQSSIRAFEFWKTREDAEKHNPSVPGTPGCNYIRFLKRKRKEASSDIQYYRNKLNEARSKLLFI